MPSFITNHAIKGYFSGSLFGKTILPSFKFFVTIITKINRVCYFYIISVIILLKICLICYFKN